MYFITTICKFDEYGPKGTRCVGYFKDLEEAKDIVTNNKCDLWETIYNYAVIEKIGEGLYQYDQNPIWFQWCHETKTYKEIEKPEEAKNFVGMSIG